MRSDVEAAKRSGHFGTSLLRIYAPVGIVLLAMLATTVATVRMVAAGPNTVRWEVAAPWLTGVALSAVAAWLPQLAEMSRSARDGWRPHRPKWSHRAVATWFAMIALAALPRFIRLDRFPTVINGDEGEYLLMAVSGRSGDMINPFGTGWLGVPNLYPFAQGWVSSIVGTDLAGHRVLGALAGTVGVLATWRFGRHVVGRWPALAGAAMMATLPYHLYFSRSALNHITDPTTLMLALLFLWRSVRYGRRGEAFLCGAMVGFGWYGYWGARVYPLIVALLLAIAATDRRVGIRRAISLGLWVAAGFVATTAPLLAWFFDHPSEFRNRLAATSPFTIDAWRTDPSGVLAHYLDNVRQAVAFPLIDDFAMFYRHQAPFLGWAATILILFGVAGWLLEIARRRPWRTAAWILVPWMVLALGVAMTDPVQSQRFVALTPFWMLAAGSGLVVVIRWFTPTGYPSTRRVQGALTTVAIAALALVNLTWWTSEDRPLDTYSDPRTIAAWDIGWRLAHGDEDEGDAPAILFAGSPFMFIGDWGSLWFQAPNASLAGVKPPIEDADSAPPLPGNTVLVIVPERALERCAAELAYPGVTVAEARTNNGALLYLAIYRGTDPGWSTETTPAGSTFTVAGPAECPDEPPA